MSTSDLHTKQQRLKSLLQSYGSLAVAYSGGVDSTFLAAFANDVLPGRVLLLNAVSPSFPEDEAAFVQDFAQERNIRLMTVPTEELQSEDYANNPPSRCYFCKTEMFSRLWPVAKREGLAVLADGANADDLRDFRPGHKAAHEQDVVHPLQQAGFTKDDIRAASREMDLPTWDKPAFACLASRFPYGERITERKLKRVERAERVLRELGYRVYRVRSHDNLARIEVGKDELPRAFEQRDELVRRLKKLNYAFVTLDLTGFRSGAMNEALGLQQQDAD